MRCGELRFSPSLSIWPPARSFTVSGFMRWRAGTPATRHLTSYLNNYTHARCRRVVARVACSWQAFVRSSLAQQRFIQTQSALHAYTFSERTSRRICMHESASTQVKRARTFQHALTRKTQCHYHMVLDASNHRSPPKRPPFAPKTPTGRAEQRLSPRLRPPPPLQPNSPHIVNV